MMYKRYFGQFKDNKQVLYEVQIWQESDSAFTVEEITLQDEALRIEWGKKDKLDPIRTSGATLNILCQSDRKFIDLYTVAVGTVRLDVYRAESLYWSGTISTESYEEPYYTSKGYAVTLTFSDFNILDRIKYSLTGFKTINEVINYCLTSAGIQYTNLIKKISTFVSQYDLTSDVFEVSSILSDNFFDEDSEADTLKSVLEYILRPFTAHIMQKNGNIYIFDINSLSAESASEVVWCRKDSSLTVDKLYNDAKVTFSPYEKKEILKAEVTEDDWDEDLITNNAGVLVNVDRNDSTPGFRIKFDTGKSDVISITNSDAKFFLLKPIYSGTEARGVMYCCKPDEAQYGHASTSIYSNGIATTELFKVNTQPYIGYISYRQARYMLKLTLDFMYDVRYNPFEEKNTGNEEGNYERMQNWCNFAYVPIMITLRDASGNALYHYNNKACIGSHDYAIAGTWQSGEAAWGDAFLAYYDDSNRTSATGLGGWATNKQVIGYYVGDLPKNYSKRGDGQFIALPNTPGWLDIRVGVGMYQIDHDNYEEKDIYSRCRWIMYKSVTLELVDSYGNKISLKDQVHKAWINRNAEDAYEVDTHVGTMANAAPTARGVLFNTSTKYIITELYRNGITAAIEKLMIGTIYSQFAARKNKLTGTVRLLPSFSILSDKNITGKYMLTYEMQSLAVATSEINMIEIESDNYQGVEFTE